jgi:hypothetical protein
MLFGSPIIQVNSECGGPGERKREWTKRERNKYLPFACLEPVRHMVNPLQRAVFYKE